MSNKWKHNGWIALLLIAALLAVGLAVPGAVDLAGAQNGQPLVYLRDGDLWAWDGASVRQLTTWGYNERPVLAPDGTRVAYNSWAQIVADYLATNPGIGGLIPSNIWVLDPVTGDAFRVADQPANASWLQPGVTDNVIVRGTPAWSPDGNQLAWTEMVIPQNNYQLVTYDFATGSQQVVVTQMPYPWADAGNVIAPDVSWGQAGIAVSIVAVNASTGDFEERLYLYAPSGGLINDTLIGGSATEWPEFTGWMTANGQEYFGLMYGSGKRYLLDPATGQQTPMPGVPERYSVTASTGVTAYPSAWINAAGNVETSWTATYANGSQQQDLPFEGTPVLLAIAPDGGALAYIADAVYVWANGSASAVPGTQGIASSWDVGLVWGPNAWRVRTGAGGGAVTCSPAPRLSAGEAAQVLPGLPNVVRTQPRRGADSTIVGEIPGGSRVMVLDGPECGPEGRYWWQVDYQGLEGWTAEGQGGVYWLQPVQGPVQACLMTPRLTVGTTAYITPGTPNVIRSLPRRGADSTVVGWIPGDGVFRVLGGPECGPEGRYWWQVEYRGITGWTAEGENGIYWAAPFGCPASPPPRLAAGMQARITPGLPNNLRSGPSPSASFAGQIPARGVFTILSGPVCGEEGRSYWRVQYGDQIGWTAEGYAGSYWIEPWMGDGPGTGPGCTLAPRLAVGDQGYVLPGPSNVLRSAPGTGTDSVVIGDIPGGGFFTVLSGPVCGNDNRYWWQVRYQNAVGWTAEGENGTYWIAPVG